MTERNSAEGTGVKPALVARGYEVSRRIAVGGMAEVFLAAQVGPSGFRRQVVLKRIHPHLSEEPRYLQMFLNEARIAADLSHPNIVHIYELFRDGASSYVIAMEYVHGETASSLMRETLRRDIRIPPGCILRVVAAVCEALHHAWEEPAIDGSARRIIHRDVSPPNVLLGVDGQVKLADFGIAKALLSEGLTKVATLKGKFGYMSPEQVRCDPLDNRSDIFSLGTMLYEMTVGRRLFRRESDVETLQAILKDDIPPPSSLVPDYPADLEPVVMRALARDRDDRYPTARAFADALAEVARKNQWDMETGPLAALVRQVVAERAPAAANPVDWIRTRAPAAMAERVALAPPPSRPTGGGPDGSAPPPSQRHDTLSEIIRQIRPATAASTPATRPDVGSATDLAPPAGAAGRASRAVTALWSSSADRSRPWRPAAPAESARGTPRMPALPRPESDEVVDDLSNKTAIVTLVLLFAVSFLFWVWAIPQL